MDNNIAKTTIEDIRNKFEAAAKMPTVPDKGRFAKYLENHVFDEDRSVKWNREEFIRRNTEYNNEITRLRKERSAAENEGHNLAKKYITDRTSMNDKQASIYWSYIWYEHYSSFDDLFQYLDEMVDLYNEIDKAGKED